jgi:hypothetical protein
MPERIEIVNMPERIATDLPVLEEMVQGGLMILYNVHVIRYHHEHVRRRLEFQSARIAVLQVGTLPRAKPQKRAVAKPLLLGITTARNVISRGGTT